MTDRTERVAPHNKMNDKVWNTAAYARLSDEDRDKLSREDLSKSLENQICFIRDSAAYANRAGESRYPIQIYKVYTDDDFTGMDFKRKAFQEMMRDVKNNVIDCIMVKICQGLADTTQKCNSIWKKNLNSLAGRSG